MKEGKQLTKMIKKESKIEREALAVAIKELAELQAFQKAAVRVSLMTPCSNASKQNDIYIWFQAESKAHTLHTTALTALQKQDCAFHAARTKYEAAQAELLALEEALEASRRKAREATETIQDKMREVEELRVQKGVDEREREVKIVELAGKKSTISKKWL